MKLPRVSFVYLVTVVSSFSVCCTAEDAIPLISDNFTAIANNCDGDYELADHIKGSQLNNTHFPLCNNASEPFTGSLKHGQNFRIRNLHILKHDGNASLFNAIDNAYIDVIMENLMVSGCDGSRRIRLAKAKEEELKKTKCPRFFHHSRVILTSQKLCTSGVG